VTKGCISCGRGGAAENKAFPLSFVDFDAEKLCDGAIDGVLTQSWPPFPPLVWEKVVTWSSCSESHNSPDGIFDFFLALAGFQGF
jgi:hypothetical protein